jgi:hypothetical protein
MLTVIIRNMVETEKTLNGRKAVGMVNWARLVDLNKD